MLFNNTFTSLCALALAALTQAAPTNLTSNFPANISETGHGSVLLERSMGGLPGGILRRNPPNWAAIPVADNDLIRLFEDEGRRWFSRLFILKLDPPGAAGPGGVNNPMNTVSFENLMSRKLGLDPEGKGWQRETYQIRSIEREWAGVEDSAQKKSSLEPILPILRGLRVGKDSQDDWDEARNVNDGVYPHGANLCYSFLQNFGYRLRTDNRGYSGKAMGPTNAYFHNWFNVVDGVIVISRGLSPHAADRDRPLKELPKHRHWSEMVYETWDRMHTEPRRGSVSDVFPKGGWFKSVGNNARGATRDNLLLMMDFLNWIVVEGVPAWSNQQAVHSIIKRCLVKRRGSEDIPRFPDTETFKMGHCYVSSLNVSPYLH